MSIQGQIASDGLVYLTCPRAGCGATLRVKPKKAQSWVTCAAPGCGHRFVLEVADRPAGATDNETESFQFASAMQPVQPRISKGKRRADEPRPDRQALVPAAIAAGCALVLVAVGLTVAFAPWRKPATATAPQANVEVARASEPRPDTKLAPSKAESVERAPSTDPAPEPSPFAQAVAPPEPTPEAKKPTNKPEAAAVEPADNVIARVKKATALIEGKHGAGSGFLIRPGILVTNAHVIDHELLEDIKVRFVTLEQAVPKRLSPILLYKNCERDLAIFRVESESNPLELATPGTELDGLSIAVVGNPRLGEGLQGIGRTTYGKLKAPAQWRRDVYFEVTAEATHGNSGGPVVDAKTGRVVGVLTGGVEGKALSLCIPFEEVAIALDRVTANEKAGVGCKHAAARHYLDHIATFMPLVERYARGCMERRCEQLRREAGSRSRYPSGPSSPVEPFDTSRFELNAVFESIQKVYHAHLESNSEIPAPLKRATAVRLEACARMFSVAQSRTETETAFRKAIGLRQSESEAAANTFDLELKKYRAAVEQRYLAAK